MKDRLKLVAFAALVFGLTAGAIWLSTNGREAWAQEVMYRGSGDPNDSTSLLIARVHGDLVYIHVTPGMNFCCNCPGWTDPNGGIVPANRKEYDPNDYPCRSYYSIDTGALARTCSFGAAVTTAAADPNDPNSNQPTVKFWAEASSDNVTWFPVASLAAYDDPNLKSCTGPITPLDPNDGDWTWWPDPNGLWPISPCERTYISDGTLPRYVRILFQTDVVQPGYLTDPNDPNSALLYYLDATLTGKAWIACSK